MVDLAGFYLSFGGEATQEGKEEENVREELHDTKYFEWWVYHDRSLVVSCLHALGEVGVTSALL